MILDTSAWIEFFNQSNNYTRVKECLENKNCYTSIISVAEISLWAQRQNIDGQLLISKVGAFSKLLPITSQIAFVAGEINHKRKKAKIHWGMIDSLIVATAQSYNIPILTKDSHFKDLKNAELI